MSTVTNAHRMVAFNAVAACISQGEQEEKVAQALADAERRGAERERAAVVKWLRSKPMIGSHHMAADELEAGKHRESGDE